MPTNLINIIGNHVLLFMIIKLPKPKRLDIGDILYMHMNMNMNMTSQSPCRELSCHSRLWDIKRLHST